MSNEHENAIDYISERERTNFSAQGGNRMTDTKDEFEKEA
jgi:hypothetical protein